MPYDTLHDRLTRAAGERTYKQIGELTGTHPETVRRYMQGHAPSCEFLAAFASALGLSGSWLLTGMEPMRNDDVRTEALRDAHIAELLHAMGESLTRLAERVDRIEVFMQTLEARLNTITLHTHPTAAPRSDADAEPARADVHVNQRARRIGVAATKRPPPPAD